MKYIKKVILENFQSHKYTEIELDPSLNVIVGPSDQGKSAIIRGIKWALFNEPSGDFFIREEEKECSVSIIFNDNTKIKRYRSNNKNAYYLYDQDGNEEIFEGFGTTVPQEIIDKTAIRKIPLDGSQTKDINIGEQLEGPFLLSEKNSSRANAIGRLVGVHIIDDALKDTLKDIRNLNIKKKNYEENLEVLYKNLQEYNYLDDLIDNFNQLKNIRLKIFNKKNKLEKLSNLSQELNKINGEIKLSHYYLEKLENINEIAEIEKNLIKYIYDYNSIKEKQIKLIRIKVQIKEDKKLLNSLINIDKIKKSIEKINILTEERNKLNKLYFNYKLINTNILKTKNKLTKLENIDKVQENYTLINKNHLIYKELLSLMQKLNTINKSLSIGIVYTEKLKNIDKISYLENTIRDKNEKLQKIILYKNKYDIITKNYNKEKKILVNLENQLKNNLLKYETILNKIEICPLCFSQIDKSKVEKIINNYK